MSQTVRRIWHRCPFARTNGPESVRARGALFYKVSAGSDFLPGGVKNRHFLRKWCSRDGEKQADLIKLK